MPQYDSFPQTMDRESLSLLQHIHPHIYAWSRYDEPNVCYHNGYWVCLSEGQALINPPILDEYVLEAFDALAQIDVIILMAPVDAHTLQTTIQLCEHLDVPCLAPTNVQTDLLEAGLPFERYVPLKRGLELFDCMQPMQCKTTDEKSTLVLCWPDQELVFTPMGLTLADVRDLALDQGFDAHLPAVGEPLLFDAF